MSGDCVAARGMIGKMILAGWRAGLGAERWTGVTDRSGIVGSRVVQGLHAS